jgi:hypothetical protein
MNKISIAAISMTICALLSIGVVVAEAPDEPTVISKGLKDVDCASTELIFNTLVSYEFNELPLWVGNEKKSSDRYALFVNKKTLTWTMVQFDQSKACILGAGENFAFTPNTNPVELTNPVKPVKPVKPSTPVVPSPQQNGKIA